MPCPTCNDTGLGPLYSSTFDGPPVHSKVLCGCTNGQRLAAVLSAIARGEPVALLDTERQGFERTEPNGEASGVLAPMLAAQHLDIPVWKPPRPFVHLRTATGTSLCGLGDREFGTIWIDLNRTNKFRLCTPWKDERVPDASYIGSLESQREVCPICRVKAPACARCGAPWANHVREWDPTTNCPEGYAPATVGIAHDLYKTGDADAPASIKDTNGAVTLGLCRRCGQGEADLADVCPGPADLKKATPVTRDTEITGVVALVAKLDRVERLAERLRGTAPRWAAEIEKALVGTTAACARRDCTAFGTFHTGACTPRGAPGGEAPGSG